MDVNEDGCCSIVVVVGGVVVVGVVVVGVIVVGVVVVGVIVVGGVGVVVVAQTFPWWYYSKSM